jgi:hypothetical protein
MSYTGYSFYQSTLIGQANTRLTSAEATLDNKVNLSTYNNKINLIDSSLFTIDARTTALESGTVSLNTFNTTVSTLNAEDISIRNLISSNAGQAESRVQDVESAVSSQFTTVVSSLSGSISDVQTSLSGRIDTIDSSISSISDTLNAVSTVVAGFELSLLSSVGVTVQGFVTQSTFDAIVSSLNDTDSQIFSSLATKVAESVQNDLDVAQNSTILSLSTAVASKLDTSTYQSFSTLVGNDKTAHDVEYSNYKSTLTGTLGTKLDSSAFSTFNGLYATDKSQLQATDYTWEKRFQAVEEYIRAMSETYVIQNNGTNYTYTADRQNLALSQGQSLFDISSINTTSGNYLINLTLSAYAYNSLIGTIDILGNNGSTVLTAVNKAAINPTNRTVTLTVPATTVLPVTIRYRDSTGNTLSSFSLTREVYESKIVAYSLEPNYVLFRKSAGWNIDASKSNTWYNVKIVSPLNEGASPDTDGDALLNEQLGAWDLSDNIVEVSGNAVLIQRNGSNNNFAQIAFHAQTAGAKMVIIYNANAGPAAQGEIVNHEYIRDASNNAVFIDASNNINPAFNITIPVLFVFNSVGNSLLTKVRNGETIYANLFYVNDDNNVFNLKNTLTSQALIPSEFHNLVPDNYPSAPYGNGERLQALNFWYRQYFYHTFTAPASGSARFYFKYNNFTVNSDVLNRILDSNGNNIIGTIENLNTSSFFRFTTASTTDFSGLKFGINALRFFQNNGLNVSAYINNTTTPDFILNNLTPGATYTIELISDVNYSDSSAEYIRIAGSSHDAAVKILPSNSSTPLQLTYTSVQLETNVVSGPQYTIDNFQNYVVSGTTRNPVKIWTPTNSFNGNSSVNIFTNVAIDVNNPFTTSTVLGIKPARTDTLDVSGVLNIQLQSFKDALATNASNVNFTNGAAVRYQKAFTISQSYVLNFNWRIESTDLTNVNKNDTVFIVIYTLVNNIPTPTIYPVASSLSNTSGLTNYSGRYSLTLQPGTYSLGFACFNEEDIPLYASSDNITFYFDNVELNVLQNPPSFSYSGGPFTATTGTAFGPISPTSTGGLISNYAMDTGNILPAGLTLNSTTGVISGTPTVTAAAANYVIRATNNGGTSTTTINLTVTAGVPIISYTSPVVFTRNVAITTISPTIMPGSGPINSYSISPGLPSGLSFNTTNGQISGTPTVSLSATNFTVTATNGAGNGTATINIRVNDIPINSAYTGSPYYVTGTIAITNITPTNNGGIPTSFAVKAGSSLPAGLIINSSTGVISGTPNDVTNETTVNTVIVASHSGSSQELSLTFIIQKGPVIQAVLDNFTAPITNNWSRPAAVNGVEVAVNTVTYLDPTNQSTTTNTMLLRGGATLPAIQTTLGIANMSIFDDALSTLPSSDKEWSNGGAVKLNNTYSITNSTSSLEFNWRFTSGDLAYPDYNDAAFAVIYDISNNTTTAYPLAYARDNIPLINNNTKYGKFSRVMPEGTYSIGIVTINESNPDPIDDPDWNSVAYIGQMRTVSDVRKYVAKYTIPSVLNGGEMYTFTPLAFGSTSLSSVSISSALPTGLSLNTTTGVISGRPTQVTSNTTYTVSFTNANGVFTTDITFAVQDVVPQFSYSTPITSATQGIAINILNTPLTANVTRGIIQSFSVSPSFPNGLTLDTVTGQISGRPLEQRASQTYTITATNSLSQTGSVTFTFAVNALTNVPISTTTILENFNSYTAIDNPVRLISSSTNATDFITSGNWFNVVNGSDGTNLYPPAHIQNTYIDVNAQGSISNCLRVLGVGYQTAITETLINLSYSDVQNATPGGVNDKALWKAGAVRYNKSFTISQNANLSFNWRVKSQDLISSQANDVAFIAVHTITSNNVTTTLNPIAFSLDSVINSIEYSGIYNISLTPGTYSFSFVVYNEQPSTAGNDNYNDLGNINLWVDNITVTPLSAPNISYTVSSLTVAANEPIAPIVATNTGGPATFTVSPSLPTGLLINANTGEITGAATTAQGATQYTITANNALNSPSTAQVTITVLASNRIMVDDVEMPLTVNSNIYNKTFSDKNYKFRGSAYVYATSATKIRVRVDGTEYAIAPTDEAGVRFGGIFQGPFPVDPKAYFFDLTTLSDPSGSPLSLTSLSDSNGGEGLYLVGIVDRLADNVGSAYTTYAYQKSQIVAVKLNNFSLIGAAVQGWGTDVALTRQSNFVYTANNIQFTIGQSFKIRSNNKWNTGAIFPGYAGYVDIEAINGTTISGFGNSDINFNQPSDKYNVVLNVANINSPTLSILKAAPAITYATSSITFTDTIPITSLTPTNTGGSISSYSISPALPTGLSLNTTTGVISGTPSGVTAAANYTVTATNTNANSVTQTSTFVINITVQALPAPSIVYSTPKTYYVNSPIIALAPTNTGGGNATYSVNPALPTGLSINSSTGVITGTPSALTAAADYTVTATNITGSSSFAINIAIVVQPAGQPYMQIAWGKWFDGVDNEYSYVNTIAIDSQQNVYTMGETQGAVDPTLQSVLGNKPSGNIGLYFIKYDVSGNPLWGKWIDDSSYDEARGIAVDSADNVYVLGKCGGNNSYIQSIVGSAKPNPFTEGGYIAKFNSSGTPIWAKWIEGTNSILSNCLTIDSANNIYIVGQATTQFSDSAFAAVMGARPSGGNSIPFIIKLNSSGVAQWGKWMISSSSYFGYGFGVTVDVAGNVYIVGEANGDLTTALMSVMEAKPVAQFNSAGFIYKFNSTGTGLWGKWFDAVDSLPNAAYTVATDSLANVYVSGKASGNMLGQVGAVIGNKPSTDNAGFLMKFGADGTGLWGKWFDGQTSWDDTRAVAVDKVTNQVYVGGFTESTNLVNAVDASGQPLLVTKPDGNRGGYILKYAADGTGLYGSWLGYSSSNVYGLNVDAVGNLYVSGFTSIIQPALAGFIDGKSTNYTSASFLFKYKPSNKRPSTNPQNATSVQMYDDGANSPIVKVFINHPNPEAPEFYSIPFERFIGRSIFPGFDFTVRRTLNFYKPGTDITNPPKVGDVFSYGNALVDKLATRHIYEVSGNQAICNIPKSVLDNAFSLTSSDNPTSFNPYIQTVYETVTQNNIWNYTQYGNVNYVPSALSNYTFPTMPPVQNLGYSIDASQNIVVNFDISGASTQTAWTSPAAYQIVMNQNGSIKQYEVGGGSGSEAFSGKSRIGNNVQLKINRYKFEFINAYDISSNSVISISNLALNAYYRRGIGTDKLSSASITDISYNVISPYVDYTLGRVLNPINASGTAGRPVGEEPFGIPGNISWRTVYYSASLDLFFGEYWAPNKYRMFKLGPGGGLIRGQGRTKVQLAHPDLALTIFYADYAKLADGSDIPNLTLLSSDTMASPFTVSVANGKYVMAGIENATIYLVKGSTYTFNVNATGQPFLIKSVNSTGLTDQYTSGVTNNGAESGAVTFVVPSNAPSLLYYNSQNTTGMGGKIVILNSGSNYAAPTPESQFNLTITGFVMPNIVTFTINESFPSSTLVRIAQDTFNVGHINGIVPSINPTPGTNTRTLMNNVTNTSIPLVAQLFDGTQFVNVSAPFTITV